MRFMPYRVHCQSFKNLMKFSFEKFHEKLRLCAACKRDYSSCPIHRWPLPIPRSIHEKLFTLGFISVAQKTAIRFESIWRF